MPASRDHVITDCLAITGESMARGVDILAHGGLVAFPTETVYGLGGDACNADAVAAIFAAKERPAFNPLISHVASAEAAFELGTLTPIAACLAETFWPGPMTLILTRRPDCPVALLTSAGLNKIALRVPSHAEARGLIEAFGRPVAAPSANPSGRISPTRADHVMAGLGGRIELVLDGGPCESGVESTVVDCTGDTARILRPGGITREAVAATLAAREITLAGESPPTGDDAPASPGQLASHYAPSAPVRLNVTAPETGIELIGFGETGGAGELGLNLSPEGDLQEAAANLFQMMHAADAAGADVIGVAPVPESGLGEAVNDRLRRAAAPRKL